MLAPPRGALFSYSIHFISIACYSVLYYKISPPIPVSSFPLKSTLTDEPPILQLIEVYSFLLFCLVCPCYRPASLTLHGERERNSFFVPSSGKASSPVRNGRCRTLFLKQTSVQNDASRVFLILRTLVLSL